MSSAHTFTVFICFIHQIQISACSCFYCICPRTYTLLEPIAIVVSRWKVSITTEDEPTLKLSLDRMCLETPNAHRGNLWSTGCIPNGDTSGHPLEDSPHIGQTVANDCSISENDAANTEQIAASEPDDVDAGSYHSGSSFYHAEVFEISQPEIAELCASIGFSPPIRLQQRRRKLQQNRQHRDRQLDLSPEWSSNPSEVATSNRCGRPSCYRSDFRQNSPCTNYPDIRLII